MIAQTTCRYIVENLTNETQPYEHKVSLMTSWYKDAPSLQNRIVTAGSRGGLESYELVPSVRSSILRLSRYSSGTSPL